MSGDIPLKIRVGIRDQWDSPKAPIRNSMDSLAQALGHVITPQVEWQTLYASLKDTFSEPSAFVPAICRIAIAFYGRLLSRLDKEPDAPWTENFLKSMTKSTNWKLRMEVSDDKSLERPHLVWNADAGNFCIHVPKHKPAGNAVIEAGFDEDLDVFFETTRSPQDPSSTRTGKEPESELPKEDNWTDIGDVNEQRTETAREGASPLFVPFPRVARKTQVVASKVGDLPTVDMVPRPAKLFKSIAPHVLTVTSTKIPLLIQGSHQPSLEYIASYLKKWARIDQNNTLKQNLLKVTMVESAFFSDVIDTITIEPNYFRGDPEPLNPALILGFIEGVLGYTETFTNGTRWAFKLDPESHLETSLLERNRGIL